MKTRWKILLVIFAAILCSWLAQNARLRPMPTPAAAYSTKKLQETYAGFNGQYFQNSLPKDVVIDYSEYNPEYAATTRPLPDGRFHIAINETYAGAERMLLITILHEECHVKTWDLDMGAGGNDMHGKHWRACMLQLDAQGVFREIIIDGYREKMP